MNTDTLYTGVRKSRLEKAAQLTDKLTSVADSAKKFFTDNPSILPGLALGALTGGVAWGIRPKDEDLNEKREFIESVLEGAALGGLAGYGKDRLGNIWFDVKDRFLADSGNPEIDSSGVAHVHSNGSFPSESGIPLDWGSIKRHKNLSVQSTASRLENALRAAETKLGTSGSTILTVTPDYRGRRVKYTVTAKDGDGREFTFNY